MSEELNGKIEARMVEVKGQFESVEKERKGLVDKRNEFVNQVSTIDRRLSEISAIQIELRGRYQELGELLPKKEVTPTLPSPDNEKEKKAKKEQKERTN